MRPPITSVFLSAAMVIAFTLPAAPSAEAAVHAPTSLTSFSQSTTAIAVRWSKTSNAYGYQVQYSTERDLSKPGSTKVTTNSAELQGLKSGMAYYLRVRALDSASKFGPYSATIKVATTSAGGYTLLSPRSLAATVRSTNSLTYRWSSRGNEVRYRLQYSKTATFASSSTLTTSDTQVRVTKLAAHATYYARVRALGAKDAPASQNSPAVKATTKSYPYRPITGVKVVDASTAAIALQWRAVPGAVRYRVRYSRAAAMTEAVVRYTATNWIELDALKPGTGYYVQVRVVDATLDSLNSYSSAVRVGTAKPGGFAYLAPTGLHIAELGSSSVRLIWNQRGAGLSYQVRAVADKASSPIVQQFDAPGGRVTALKPKTAYRFAVGVVGASGVPDSADSRTLAASTEPSGKAMIRVASYNVRCHYCSDTPLANERPWSERRRAVAATILAQYPDVVGLQEASQTRLVGSDGKASKDSQFDDLVKLLGAPYAITNAYRYNCVNGYSKTRCKSKDRGASKGTKIIYNTSTVALLSKGTKRLTSPAGKYRYAVYATFKDRTTGKSFFFLNTHLEFEKDVAGSAYFSDLRAQQARDVVALIRDRSRGLPVVISGDLNTSKKTVPANAPYDVITGAGYPDPLGNGYQSTEPTAGATVQHRIRTNYNSYNGFALNPPKSAEVNGTYVDYLFASPSIQVTEWETVLNLDAAGLMSGVIPSDHNMIRATVVLS